NAGEGVGEARIRQGRAEIVAVEAESRRLDRAGTQIVGATRLPRVGEGEPGRTGRVDREIPFAGRARRPAGAARLRNPLRCRGLYTEFLDKAVDNRAVTSDFGAVRQPVSGCGEFVTAQLPLF